MTDKKEMQIQFAPGCFDSFEGTQEELDEMVAEIKNIFANMSPDDLQAQSREISVDELMADESISDDQFENILQALTGNENRKLQ